MQSLTALDVLTILGILLLYDVLKWYYREFKKEKRKDTKHEVD
jgi:hypothetical protein